MTSCQLTCEDATARSRHAGRRRALAEGSRVSADPRWGPLRGAQQLLVALAAPMRDEAVLAAKAALLRHGGWASSYLPDSALLCIGGTAAARALRRIPGVLWVVRPTNISARCQGKLWDSALLCAGGQATAGALRRARQLLPSSCLGW